MHATLPAVHDGFAHNTSLEADLSNGADQGVDTSQVLSVPFVARDFRNFFLHYILLNKKRQVPILSL
jgi:hypothetical protein